MSVKSIQNKYFVSLNLIDRDFGRSEIVYNASLTLELMKILFKFY